MVKNVKNIVLASVLTLICALSANAQETKQIAKANDIQSYKLEYIEELGGMRHDELVMILPDSSIVWKARTIEGFSMGAKAGAGFDCGQGAGSVIGYNFNVVFGYSGKLMDWDVTAGYSQISDANGKRYGAFNAFFEPSIAVAKWGKNNLQTNKFYVGGKIGVQEARNNSQFSYEDDYIVVNGTSVPTTMGLAYGLKLGYEHRQFMGATRWGVELSAHTYDVKHEFKVNGETIQNSKDQRFYVGLTFFVKGVFQKKAKNY
jgi:hypothetical protein